MRLKTGDEVTISGTVVEISPSGNAVVKLTKGTRVLINPTEIKTIHPYKPKPEKDERVGR